MVPYYILEDGFNGYGENSFAFGVYVKTINEIFMSFIYIFIVNHD